MKFAAKYIFLIIAAFNSTVVIAQNTSDMDKLLWIVDSWVSASGESRSYEEWKKIDNSLYEGNSRTVKNGEVTFSEQLKIVSTEDGIFYIADVKHNPAPVKFRLTSISDTSAVFENPEHDFPKKITYMLEDGNLHAYIEGPGKEGITKKIDFYMTKMR